MSALCYRNLSRGCCVSTICSVVQFSCAVSACGAVQALPLIGMEQFSS